MFLFINVFFFSVLFCLYLYQLLDLSPDTTTFISLEGLLAQITQLQKYGTHPSWLMKKANHPDSGGSLKEWSPVQHPANYMSLRNTKKLISGITATRINRHTDQHMSNTHKDIGRDTRYQMWHTPRCSVPNAVPDRSENPQPNN